MLQRNQQVGLGSYGPRTHCMSDIQNRTLCHSSCAASQYVMAPMMMQLVGNKRDPRHSRPVADNSSVAANVYEHMCKDVYQNDHSKHCAWVSEPCTLVLQ